jgi:hypothetical protein
MNNNELKNGLKVLLCLVAILTLNSCDGGWQKQIDDRDTTIIILTKENCQLKKSLDSLKIDYLKYANRQSDFIDEMIDEHNKCVKH